MKEKIICICMLAGLLLSGMTAVAQPGNQRHGNAPQQDGYVVAAGQVIDETGLPVIGASVIEDGTTNGVVTDMDGQFQLRVKRGATLTVSCIGYTTVSVKEAADLSVVLAEDTQMIEETVVVGYGVQRKSSLTGAISSVKSEDIENRTVTNVQSALEGKTAGVQLVATTADPGSTPTIRIRGISSNASTEPLYVVDGVRLSDISSIDVNDIESMEVLKDAASAAIYGAEAGNGVILITTKKGKAGQGQISYDFQYTVQSLVHLPRMLNAQEFVDFNVTYGLDSIEEIMKEWDGVTSVDYVAELFEKGIMQKHSLSFQNGTDKGKYYVSLTYLDNNGTIVGDKDVEKKLMATINGEHMIKNWFTVGTTNNISYSDLARPTASGSSGEGQTKSLFSNAISNDPILPIVLAPDQLTPNMQNAIKNGYHLAMDENGNYYSFPNGAKHANPFQDLASNNYKRYTYQVNGSLYANFTPIKNLVITSRFGYRLSSQRWSNYVTPYYYSRGGNNPYTTYSGGERQGIYYQWENFANYSHTWGDHTLTAMAGMSFDQNTTDYVTGTLTPNGESALQGEGKEFIYFNYASDSSTKGVKGEALTTAKTSYFGRIGYDYRNKYIFQATLRADAADLSYLPLNTRWGYFPSFSGAWTVSEEPFFSSLKQTVNFMKVRANWGRNGSLASLGNYMYSNSISTYYSYTMDGKNPGTYTLGTRPTSLGNNNIKWETSEQFDAGLDVRMFNSKLTIGFDYFNKTTRDLIVTGTTPSLSIGGTSSPMNAGDVKNYGIEFEATWKHHIGELNYSVSANLATIKNEVTYIDPSLDRIYGEGSGITAFEKDYPIYYFRGYVMEGINHETGDPIFKDVDGNGVIDSEDMTYIGSPFPDFTYGLTLSLNYKNFDFLAFGNGSYGNQIYFIATNPARTGNKYYYYDYVDRWTPDHKDASQPGAMDMTVGNRYRYCDQRIFDGSYFRIKQIQLGYTLPSRITRKAAISRMRAYVSLDDFWVITSYKGLAPDVASNSVKGMGIDEGTNPTTRKLVFGVNVSF